MNETRPARISLRTCQVNPNSNVLFNQRSCACVILSKGLKIPNREHQAVNKRVCEALRQTNRPQRN